jgi:hypothetical protein
VKRDGAMTGRWGFATWRRAGCARRSRAAARSACRLEKYRGISPHRSCVAIACLADPLRTHEVPALCHKTACRVNSISKIQTATVLNH